MGISDELRDLEGLAREVEHRNSKAQKGFQKLRERLKEGETTGDIIKDFVIVNLGTISEEATKPYREFKSQLDKNKGKQILVVRQTVEVIHPREDPYVMHIIPNPSHYSSEENLRLGVLNGTPNFDVKDGTIFVGSNPHVEESHGRFSDSRWALKKEPLSLDGYEVGRRKINLMEHVPNDTAHSVLIYTGDEVADFFRKRRGRVYDAGFKGQEYRDLSYVAALKLLGLEAPEDFKKEHKAGVDKRTEDITQKLKALSLKPNPSESELRNILNEAIELGLHNSDLVLENGPGVNVHIGAYVKGQSTRLKIEIPKD